MVRDLNKKTLVRFATVLAIGNAALLFSNALVREKVNIYYSTETHLVQLFLLSIIPIIACFLLNSSMIRVGVIIILGSLPAILVNNIYDRFFLAWPIFLPKPSVVWIILYESTYGILLVTDVLAFWTGVKLFRIIHSNTPLLSEHQA